MFIIYIAILLHAIKMIDPVCHYTLIVVLSLCVIYSFIDVFVFGHVFYPTVFVGCILGTFISYVDLHMTCAWFGDLQIIGELATADLSCT